MLAYQKLGTFLGVLGVALVAQAAQAQLIPSPSVGSSVTVMNITGSSFGRTDFWGNYQSLDLEVGAAATGSFSDFRRLDTLSLGGLGQLTITYQEGGYAGFETTSTQFTGHQVASQVNF